MADFLRFGYQRALTFDTSVYNVEAAVTIRRTADMTISECVLDDEAVRDSWGNVIFRNNDERDRAVVREVEHICRCVAVTARDYQLDGTINVLDMADEIASEVIDSTEALREIVRLVCAEKVNAMTVTDHQIAGAVRKAVLACVDKLADYRVAA